MSDIDRLQNFFFAAASVTYAGNGPKFTDPERPGVKIYRFADDILRYVDEYYVNGAKSFGSTVIWQDDQPVWHMQYRGFCHDKQASELVKKAMRAAYQEHIFAGGRGVDLIEGELKYHNVAMHSFGEFHGSDCVGTMTKGKDNLLFWHKYSGGLLVKP
ncbi:MAG: DUF5680 domain-containing protein [Patescibacteria group bacterium]